MRVHPVANIFPLMDASSIADLAADIAAHGQREPIWLHRDGSVIDGRNRMEACRRAGLEPVTRTFAGRDAELVPFVVSLNLKRRHLDESQRAVVAARLATLEHGANQHAQICAPSQDDAAALLSVSRRSVQHGRAVLDGGAPELVSAVERGTVSVSAAAAVATLPREEQAEIVARGERDILDAAKRIRAGRAEAGAAKRIEKIAEIARGNAPLVPADVDLHGYGFMPFYGHRLFGSEFNARCSDAEWRAGVTLWWAAWNQVPAASLPADDVALARLADLGRDVRGWMKLRANALHGFVLCSDGRLYHPVLAEYAMQAWDRRVRERERKERWRAGRNGPRDGDKPTVSPSPMQGRNSREGEGEGEGQGHSSVERSSTAAVRLDDEPIRDAVWRCGVAILAKSGRSEPSIRALLGRALRDHGDAQVFEALGRCERDAPADPVAYLAGMLNGRGKRRSAIQSGLEKWMRDAAENTGAEHH